MDTDLPRDIPTSILLATDMGARCDRARSRAVLLAGQWNAKLVAITVVPSRQGGIRDEVLPPPAWARRASALEDAEVALQRDMAGCGMAVETRVGTGPVGPALLRAAEESGCGLIVTGSGDGPFLSSLPGSTIRWLSRHARQPVLVVRNRPRDAYRHLAFASDFSRPAQQAISLAAHWFGATVSSAALLHGADLPLSAMGGAASGRDDQAAREQADLSSHARTVMAGLPLPSSTTGVDVVVEHMDPARLVNEYIRSFGAELVSVGSHGRSALADVLLGSVAQRILETARSDVLIVRPQA